MVLLNIVVVFYLVYCFLYIVYRFVCVVFVKIKCLICYGDNVNCYNIFDYWEK